MHKWEWAAAAAACELLLGGEGGLGCGRWGGAGVEGRVQTWDFQKKKKQARWTDTYQRAALWKQEDGPDERKR